MKKSLSLSISALLILILLTACSVTEPKNVLAETPVSNSKIYENNINSILWFQKSGETRALYYQAFNLAHMVVEKTLSEKSFEKKPAIVVDLDETMIDNSTYLATLALNGIEDLSCLQTNFAKTEGLLSELENLPFGKLIKSTKQYQS